MAAGNNMSAALDDRGIVWTVGHGDSQALAYDSAYEEKKLWALKAFERYHVKSIYAGPDNMAVIASVIL